MLCCGGESRHTLVPGYLDDPDWESITCKMAPFWNSRGFHHKEQHVQMVCAWPYLASVKDMSWKHASKHTWKQLGTSTAPET